MRTRVWGKYWLLIVLLAVAVTLIALYLFSRRWKNVAVDTPWAGPGVQAKELVREPGYFTWSPHGGTKAKVWVDAKNVRHYKATVFIDSEKYLDSVGLLSRWSGIGSRVVAPYNFTIVSIDPTVVVMAPTDQPLIKTNIEPDIGRTTLLNLIQYSTSVPGSGELTWFSSDLSQGPSPVVFSPGGVAVIPLPNGKLVLTRQGSQCKVTRE